MAGVENGGKDSMFARRSEPAICVSVRYCLMTIRALFANVAASSTNKNSHG